MQLCLDGDFSNESSVGATNDARVNAALELSMEERAYELAVALLRQYVGRLLPPEDPLIAEINAAFPRTAQSISQKSVVSAILQFQPQKQQSLLDTLMGTVLTDFTQSGSSTYAASQDSRVAAFFALPAEHQVYELAVAVLRQFLAVKAKQPSAAGALASLPPQFEARFPKTANAIGKAAVLATLLQLEGSAPPSAEGGVSVLEAALQQRMTMLEAMGEVICKEPTQTFTYNADETVEINGFRVSDQQTGAYVNSLDELDFANMVCLGRGAGGSVMKVVHSPSGFTFAVKEILLSEESIEQVKNEVQVVWGSVKAPVTERCASLIDCYGVFYRAVTLYIVMELLDGSLKDLIKRRRALDESSCAAIAFQALQGLRFLHDVRRQLHRDIKPHNILFRASDGAVKVADFGISSKPLETIKNFKADTYCGTTLYMSPARVAGEPYGYEGDLWSFGVTMLELALGAVPFEANVYTIDRLRTNPPRLPATSPFGAPFSPEFQDFIAQCCQPVAGPHVWTAAQLLQHPFLQYMTWDDSRRIAMGFR